jgi:tetratricopeptide (TPR) repeat protein
VTLPLVLVILDAYPLRRRAWLEKLPFFILSAAALALGVFGQHGPHTMRSFAEYGLAPRLAQSCYGLAFYLWKTLIPLGLSPIYELPVALDPFELRFLASAALVAALSAWVWVQRKKQPAFAALWLFYVLSLLPVLGLLQFGDQIAADRYSYLPCLGWALLFGAAVLGAGPRGRALAAAWLIALAVLGWRQTLVWRDSVSLWTHALAVDPDIVMAHNNLGVELANHGRPDEALTHFEAALKLHPGDPIASGNYQALLARKARH